MSWNKYFIVVKKVENKNLEEIIKSIGYSKLEYLSKTDFRAASHNRNFDEISFGLVDEGFWIICPNQVEKFFNEEPSQLEINLSKVFNKTSILALAENATVAAFGFNLIENGNRKRVLSGCDGEYYYEYGQRLEIEDEDYKRFKENLDEDEKEEIREDEGEEGLENYMKFESSWGIPTSLLKRKIGKTVDDIYDENPEFSNYKFK